MAGGVSNIDLAVTSLLPSSYTHIIVQPAQKSSYLVPLYELDLIGCIVWKYEQ